MAHPRSGIPVFLLELNTDRDNDFDSIKESGSICSLDPLAACMRATRPEGKRV